MSHLDIIKRAFERENLPKGKVFDIGCRDISLKPWFESLGYKWHGCDIMSTTQYSPAIDNEITYCDMNVKESCGYPENYFDVVFFSHSFEHLWAPAKGLDEASRLVKNGGYIFIGMPRFGEKQILYMDWDHISVLHPMQMRRLTEWLNIIYGKKQNIVYLKNYEEFLNPDNPDDAQDSAIYVFKVVKK